MMTAKKAGRPAGQTKATGARVSPGRPAGAQNLETAALLLRLRLLQARAPHGTAPTAAALAAVLDCSLPTFNRRKRGAGSFSPAQLAAGAAYCEAHCPAGFGLPA